MGPGWTIFCKGDGCFHSASLRQWNRRPSFWRRALPWCYAVTLGREKVHV
jgi:hypothetical protein